MNLETSNTKMRQPRVNLPEWLVPAACGICAVLVLIFSGVFLPARRAEASAEKTETDTTAPASLVLDRNEWYGKDLRYFYNQLTDHEKLIYTQIYDGIVHYQTEISISVCTKDEMDHVLYVLNIDNPELFHVQTGTIWSSGEGIVRFDPKYRMDQAAYNTICSHIHETIDELKRLIPAGADDYTKEVIINTYVVDHCEFLDAGDDSSAYADASLYRGKSQCSGYAQGFLLLLRSFGIESLAVSGTHEWNIVRINGNWYHVDNTWNDVQADEAQPLKGNRFFCWLNLPDSMIDELDHRNYRPAGFTIPSCITMQDNYAVREGIYIAGGTGDVALQLYTELERRRAAGSNAVIFLVNDRNAVTDWNSIWNDFYYKHNGYGWLLYTPNETCMTGYAVWKGN